MVLQFTPPSDLINAYLNRPSSGQIASEGVNEAIKTYIQSKAQQSAATLAQQQKDIEMAKGLAANGQDFTDAYNQVVAARNPQPTAKPSSYPLGPATTPLAGLTPQVPESPANFQPQAGGQGTAVNPSGSPIINHWNASMGASSATSGGPMPPKGKPSDAPLTNSPLTDPLVNEYQQDPIAFKKKHGEAGIAKLGAQAELDKKLMEKPEDKYYTTDQATNLLSDISGADKKIAAFPKDKIPRDAVHLMMSGANQNLNVGTKESNQQDKLEEQYRKSFQSIRGDPAMKRIEEQRDAATTAYNRIKEVQDNGQVLNPIDYVDILGQIYKARTGSAPTNEVLQQARQATAKGQFGKAFTYITGEQAPATTQDIQDSLQKMALSMGNQADKLHSGYMRNRIKPPMGLAHDRVANVDAERGMSFSEATGLDQQGSNSSIPSIGGTFNGGKVLSVKKIK